MKNRLIAEWPKGNGNVIRIRLGFYKKRLRIDLREYYRDGDDYQPTRKGVNLPAERLKDLKEACRLAIKLAKRLRRNVLTSKNEN